MGNKLLRYQNGTWIVGPGASSKTKSKTASQTVQNVTNPGHSNKLIPSKSALKDAWQSIGSPWWNLVISGALGVSLAFNVMFYIQYKYAETKVSEKNAEIRVINK